MKRNKILTLTAAWLLAIGFSSCADMMWDVGTGVSTGTDYYGPYYYGYNNSIWNNAINGFYGPIWTSPAPPRPYRPAGGPGPAIRPVSPPNGANRPVIQPSNSPSGNPEGVTGQPIRPSTQPNGNQRPGNNGRPPQ